MLSIWMKWFGIKHLNEIEGMIVFLCSMYILNFYMTEKKNISFQFIYFL